MFNNPDLSDQDLAKLLPRVMGTQHPDNVSSVPFGDSPRVDSRGEEDEVFYNISVLNVPELMIDYERKRGAATPLWNWLQKCSECLLESRVGKDFRVTPRLPNGDRDRDDPYFWQSQGIFTNALLVADRMGLDYQPMTEFIIPDVTDGRTVAKTERAILDRYLTESRHYSMFGDGTPFPAGEDFFVQGIPLIEEVDHLMDPGPIWEALIRAREELCQVSTHVQRSFIARSDPALKAGMIPALIAARAALAEGERFGRENGIRIPQIVGIGSAPFRGGLTPDPERIAAVIETYPGAATLTVQSAFRYDHPEADVIRSVKEIEDLLGGEIGAGSSRDSNNTLPDPEAILRLRPIVKKLKELYQQSYAELMPVVLNVASQVPSHRERYDKVEVTGEDRSVGGLPAVRAIKYACSCYSLGVPPGILGLRGLAGLDAGERSELEQACPRLYYWLGEEMAWLDPEALAYLESAGFASVAEDVRTALDLADRTGEADHNEFTARVRERVNEGEELSGLIMEAAGIRRFLG
jgi:phosphoenolpyruvate carboxylase